VFPVMYELNLCILFKRNSVFKGLNREARREYDEVNFRVANFLQH
jgi:hypothetical protein